MIAGLPYQLKYRPSDGLWQARPSVDDGRQVGVDGVGSRRNCFGIVLRLVWPVARSDDRQRLSVNPFESLFAHFEISISDERAEESYS